MKEFWKKYKIPSVIAIYIGTFILVFFIVINPLIKDIRDNSDQIQRNRIDSEINKERISKLPDMREAHAVYEQEKDNLNVILDQENSVDFIKKIEYLADETGNKISISIADINNQEKNQSEKKSSKDKKDPESVQDNLPSDKYLSMKLILEGNYENFIKFLYKLENLDYYVNVISVDSSKKAMEEERLENGSNKEEAPVKKYNLVSALEIAAYTK